MANRNFGKVENLRNLAKIIASFLISQFSIFPYSQNRKFGFKNLGKKFPRFPRLSRFLIFRTGRFLSKNCFLADLVGSDWHISLLLKIVSMFGKKWMFWKTFVTEGVSGCHFLWSEEDIQELFCKTIIALLSY